MKYQTLFAVALLACSPALGQDTEPLNIGEPQPIVFQVADSAEVVKRPDGRVMLTTKGLDEEKHYAVILPVANSQVTWIEAYPNGMPPAKAIDAIPSSPGKFMVEGEPGQMFLIRVPNGWEKPAWLEVTLPGKPKPPPPPPVDEGIKSLSSARANALDDPDTRAKLKKAIELKVAELTDMESVTVEAGIMQMIDAIEDVLAARPKELQNVLWKPGWREPIGAYIRNAGYDGLDGYLYLMSSAAKGL